MIIETTRFGELDIGKDSVIHFPDGIAPFGKDLDFSLVVPSEDGDTVWLQSLQYPQLSFWTGFALRLFEKRDFALDTQLLSSIGINNCEGLCILVILTKLVDGVTANLLAPILVNMNENIGKQVVLPGKMELIRVPIQLGYKKGLLV